MAGGEHGGEPVCELAECGADRRDLSLGIGAGGRHAEAERAHRRHAGASEGDARLRLQRTQALFAALKTWRRDAALAQGVPPYVVFHDRTLLEIAQARPGSLARLGEVGGVGQAKLDRYGEAVLSVLQKA